MALSACSPGVAPAPPESVVVSDSALAGYQLHAGITANAGAGRRTPWWLAYVEPGTAHLMLAHGATAGADAGASVDVAGAEVVDRVDIAPGINPVLGAFVAFDSGGARHLVYVDQQLPDQRLTKWLRRPAPIQDGVPSSRDGPPPGDDPGPWEIRLLPPQLVPVAAAAHPGGASVLGVEIVGDPAASAPLLRATLLADGQPMQTPRLEHLAGSARLGVPRQGAPPDWRPVMLPVGCGERASTHYLVGQPDGGWRQHAALAGSPHGADAGAGSASGLPPDSGAGWPLDVACVSGQPVALLARPDRRLRGTDAWEIVLAGGGTEQAVTLAREVTQVGLVRRPPTATYVAGEAPGLGALLAHLRVLFTERALDDATPAQFQLVMIEPGSDDGDGVYQRRVLWSGPERIVDFTTVAAGTELIVAFRTNAAATAATGAPATGDRAAGAATLEPSGTPLRVLSLPLAIDRAG